MRLVDLFRYFTHKKNARSISDWDEARQLSGGDRLADQKSFRGQDPSDASAVVKQAHWIALVCFIEEMDPNTLSLSPALLSRIEHDLDKLQELNSLEAFNTILEMLSSGEIVVSNSQKSDADPS